MKKKYITPSMNVMAVECESHILAGSPNSQQAGTTTGQENKNGNSSTSGTESSGSSGITQCSKGHYFNIWDDDEE